MRLIVTAARKKIRSRIDEIEADARFQAGQKSPAKVQVNAPLALIQTSMEAERAALKWALVLLAGT